MNSRLWWIGSWFLVGSGLGELVRGNPNVTGIYAAVIILAVWLDAQLDEPRVPSDES